MWIIASEYVSLNPYVMKFRFLKSFDLQLGNHLKFLSANNDNAMVDLTGVPPCIYTVAESDCETTGGTTYAFWIKLLDNTPNWISSSTAWSPVRAGMQIRLHSSDKVGCVM